MSDQSPVQEDRDRATEPPRYPWLSAYPDGVDWNQEFTAAPVHRFLSESAERFPSNACVTFLGKTLTYGEIANLVDRAAAGLQKIGISKGTKVGLFLPNSPTAVIYYYAILRIGATVVNYNPLYTVEELSFQVGDSETEIMVTLDLKLLFDKVEALLAGGKLKRAVICSFPDLLPGLKSILFKLFKAKERARPRQSKVARQLVFEADLLANDGRVEPAEIDTGDIAVLQYTGGTTGTPKGAMLTHANLSINVRQVEAWSPDLVAGAEKMIGVLPFFHVFAMTGVMNFGISRAAELIVMPRFVLDDLLNLINEHRPTVMAGVPTIFNAIMNHPKIRSFDLSSLKLCLSGGAPLPLEVKRGFESLTGCKLIEAYGLSETSPAATLNPLEGPVKEGSIGQPLPATILSLRDLENPELEVPLGDKGEICIAGPQVMKGYWNRPEATASTFVGEFFRTGDVGTMDDQGFTFIVDRIKDLIICSGYNVYPRRIEEAIYEFEAVEEVTVIGIPDAYRGEAPKAFVKLKPGQTATSDELLAFLKSKISKIEMPEEIEFRDELPKTMIGKLSKKELKQEEAERSQK